MVHLVCLFVKTQLLALLQDNSLDLVSLCCLAHVVCMCEEYNYILSTPIEAIGQYRYISKSQISARYIDLGHYIGLSLLNTG